MPINSKSIFLRRVQEAYLLKKITKKTATHFNKGVILIISVLFGATLKYAISDGTHFNELLSNKN